MAKEFHNLVPDSILNEDSIKYQIDKGLLTNAVYQTLSPTEKSNVQKILFDIHSQPVGTASALSALEFTIFGLSKLFFLMFPDPSSYDSTTQAFYNSMKNYVEQHEITTNPNDWYIPYAQANMLAVKNNRATYMQLKQNITG